MFDTHSLGLRLLLVHPFHPMTMISKIVKVGTPLVPFVDSPSRPGLVDPRGMLGDGFTLNADVRAKYEAAKLALGKAGVQLLEKEWPERHFEYLGRKENVLVESLFTGRLVNGKPLHTGPNASFAGQVSLQGSRQGHSPGPLEGLAKGTALEGSRQGWGLEAGS